MLKTTSQFETEIASKYLIRMSKHFAHKTEVTYDENNSEVKFPCGQAWMKAEDGRLIMTVEANSENELAMTKSIIEKHLIGFAYKENLESLNWEE